MNKAEAKPKQLNQKQLDILNMLFRFRFGTTDLLGKALGVKDRVTIHLRLKVLSDQGYLTRRYDGMDRLQGKPAAYFLLPKGLKALRLLTDRTDVTDNAIKNAYNDKNVQEGFINHCLAVFGIYCRLKAEHGKNLEFLSKSDLAEHDFLPDKLPDALISLNGMDFFLDVFDAPTELFVITRRVRQYTKYADSDKWGDDPFPSILIVCEKKSIQERLRKRIDAILVKTEHDDLDFRVTRIDESLPLIETKS